VTTSPGTGTDVSADDARTEAAVPSEAVRGLTGTRPAGVDALQSTSDHSTPPESALPEQPVARVPGWAWVAITLMAVLVLTGASVWVVARNANPSTPAAVTEMETLVAELTTLNRSLATTNSLMSNAIANSQQLSANAQAQLASVSTQLTAVDASLGQARSLLGNQLSGTMRSKLAKSQDELQSREGKLAGLSARVQQQQDSGTRGDIGAIGKRVGAAISSGTQRESVIEAQVVELQAQVGALQSTLRGEATLRAAVTGERLRVDRLQARIRAMQRVVTRLRTLVGQLRAGR
jgi:hypothetical protein